jgi:hypothetical protein
MREVAVRLKDCLVEARHLPNARRQGGGGEVRFFFLAPESRLHIRIPCYAVGHGANVNT